MAGNQADESLVNRSGGIKGRPVHFVVQDDQSDPKNALQMARHCWTSVCRSFSAPHYRLRVTR